MSATWYKLKSGEWGVKIRHDGQVDEAVTVTNKKGEEKTVYLVKRAAKFDDAQLWEVTTDQPEKPVAQRIVDEEPF